MRFQLDHDWQGNMATPRARIGEKRKNAIAAGTVRHLDIVWPDRTCAMETA